MNKEYKDIIEECIHGLEEVMVDGKSPPDQEFYAAVRLLEERAQERYELGVSLGEIPKNASKAANKKNLDRWDSVEFPMEKSIEELQCEEHIRLLREIIEAKNDVIRLYKGRGNY